MSASGYENPFRSIHGLTPERIDMGVDYGGTGPVYALGPGVITNVYNSGWPGGVFVSELLTSGPYAGKYVYEAETANPKVHTGQHVDANTITSYMHGASSIEIGWAQPPGTGAALGASQFSGANSTAYGQSMSNLLKSLGAPAGIVQGGGVRGSVPSGFNNNATLTSIPGAIGSALTGGFTLSALASALGLPSVSDMLERGALIILGAVLIILGLIKVSGHEQQIKAAAVDMAGGGPEDPYADFVAAQVAKQK